MLQAQRHQPPHPVGPGNQQSPGPLCPKPVLHARPCQISPLLMGCRQDLTIRRCQSRVPIPKFYTSALSDALRSSLAPPALTRASLSHLTPFDPDSNLPSIPTRISPRSRLTQNSRAVDLGHHLCGPLHLLDDPAHPRGVSARPARALPLRHLPEAHSCLPPLWCGRVRNFRVLSTGLRG